MISTTYRDPADQPIRPEFLDELLAKIRARERQAAGRMFAELESQVRGDEKGEAA